MQAAAVNYQCALLNLMPSRACFCVSVDVRFHWNALLLCPLLSAWGLTPSHSVRTFFMDDPKSVWLHKPRANVSRFCCLWNPMRHHQCRSLCLHELGEFCLYPSRRHWSICSQHCCLTRWHTSSIFIYYCSWLFSSASYVQHRAWSYSATKTELSPSSRISYNIISLVSETVTQNSCSYSWLNHQPVEEEGDDHRW